MSIPNLPVDFKDDILNTGVNQKRKYQQTYNSDGSVSFEDVTAYQQKGSNFGAQEVNETNGAVNNIYAERIVDLDELDLVTEPGFFVDALAVKELNSKRRVKLWDGSASSGDTINLSESAYEYNWLVFLNNTDAIKATLPITPNMSAVRCSGTTVTSQGNFGSLGVYGSLTNNGSTVVLTDVGYITHGAGSDHSTVSARTVSEVYGFR